MIARMRARSSIISAAPKMTSTRRKTFDFYRQAIDIQGEVGDRYGEG
jgi:hypothetical protein